MSNFLFRYCPVNFGRRVSLKSFTSLPSSNCSAKDIESLICYVSFSILKIIQIEPDKMRTNFPEPSLGNNLPRSKKVSPTCSVRKAPTLNILNFPLPFRLIRQSYGRKDVGALPPLLLMQPTYDLGYTCPSILLPMFKDDRAFRLLHKEIPQIFVLSICIP